MRKGLPRSHRLTCLCPQVCRLASTYLSRNECPPWPHTPTSRPLWAPLCPIPVSSLKKKKKKKKRNHARFQGEETVSTSGPAGCCPRGTPGHPRLRGAGFSIHRSKDRIGQRSREKAKKREETLFLEAELAAPKQAAVALSSSPSLCPPVHPSTPTLALSPSS